MAQFPVRIHVKPYTGRKPDLQRKYHAKLELARRIEEYLNAQDDGESIQMFTYYEIASAVGCDKREVYDILMPVCGGSNGITVGRSEKRT